MLLRLPCVSHAFLRSWRCYPNLTLSVDSLGIKEYGSKYEELTRDFISRVDHVNYGESLWHGVKEFRPQNNPCSTMEPSIVDRWIQDCYYTWDNYLYVKEDNIYDLAKMLARSERPPSHFSTYLV
jgi:hypothetical protein